MSEKSFFTNKSGYQEYLDTLSDGVQAAFVKEKQFYQEQKYCEYKRAKAVESDRMSKVGTKYSIANTEYTSQRGSVKEEAIKTAKRTIGQGAQDKAIVPGQGGFIDPNDIEIQRMQEEELAQKQTLEYVHTNPIIEERPLHAKTVKEIVQAIDPVKVGASTLEAGGDSYNEDKPDY